MKLTVILLLAACLSAGARGYTQSVTLSLKNATLEKVFKEIRKQTGYDFVFNENVQAKKISITINLKEVGLRIALDKCLEGLPLFYSLQNNMIVVKAKKESTVITSPSLSDPLIDIKGKILNDKSEPLSGVTVIVRGTNKITITNESGNFELKGVADDAMLDISIVGYVSQTISVNGRSSIDVKMTLTVKQLDELIVQAYGTTTRRFNTGNIGKVNSEQIANQPVANPLSTLQGRIPGLVVTQSNGVPGSSVKIQIRGRNSIVQGSDPLLVVDGIPFTTGNNYLNQLSSAAGNPNENPIRAAGLSPFALINPADIESIEVLKDADATAIYGSRGANGAILVTTKKGKQGKTQVNVNIYTGVSKVTRPVEMLNTQEYLQMRREAFANDGIIPNTTPGSPGYAPDLLIWDTTKYTNLTELLTGENANFTNIQVSFSGGNANTRFLLGGNYNHQTTVFPGDFSDNRGSVHFNLNHSSSDRKFFADFTGNYSSGKSNLLSTDLSSFLYLPPNLPPLFDSAGSLKWQEKGVSYSNPLSSLFRKYNTVSENLITNLLLQYKVLPYLTIKSSFGYNTVRVEEVRILPRASIDPQSTSLASSTFANSFNKGWIIEPQLEFIKSINKGKLSVLFGSSWQDNTRRSSSVVGQNYTNDALLGSIAGAGSITASNTYSVYRYNAFFGRINYNLLDKYIVNLSGRKDGSSRFGPGREFTSFGAIGVGWIFSNEKFIAGSLPFISFGKLRGSYGTSGNDQIGDYQYLDTWGPTVYPYQGVPGIAPVRLLNPEYGWEVNKKLEVAIELGFLKDRIFLSTSYFRNKSDNQLVSYALPIQTGFNNVTKNLDAVVSNKGFEIVLTTQNIRKKKIEWETSINLTLQKNKLISFPGLASSSYANTYVEGYSLSVLRGYRYLGVDPSTGVYKFEDVDKDGFITNPNDYQILGNIDPKYYGGISNTVKVQNFQLELFVEFRKQKGRSFLANQFSYMPGYQFNQPAIILNRWRSPGDVTNIQRLTVSSASNAYKAMISYLSSSDGQYTDASYIRGKTLSLSYSLNEKLLKRIKCENMRIYFNARNLFTISDYEPGDPETQNIYALPPLRTFVFGIQASF